MPNSIFRSSKESSITHCFRLKRKTKSLKVFNSSKQKSLRNHVQNVYRSCNGILYFSANPIIGYNLTVTTLLIDLVNELNKRMFVKKKNDRFLEWSLDNEWFKRDDI